MTTKRQAEICVERNLSDDEIVDMTGCHPECVEFVRAWGRGECVQFLYRASNSKDGQWGVIPDTDDRFFFDAERYRIAPRRIHLKATLPDGTEREASFPEPVRQKPERGERLYRSDVDWEPCDIRWAGDDEDNRALMFGCLFRTEQQALERDKAMIWISGGETDQ